MGSGGVEEENVTNGVSATDDYYGVTYEDAQISKVGDFKYIYAKYKAPLSKGANLELLYVGEETDVKWIQTIIINNEAAKIDDQFSDQKPFYIDQRSLPKAKGSAKYFWDRPGSGADRTFKAETSLLVKNENGKGYRAVSTLHWGYGIDVKGKVNLMPLEIDTASTYHRNIIRKLK